MRQPPVRATRARPAVANVGGGTSLRELAGPPSDGLTPEKAQQILDDGSVRGYALTDRQRRFMGARANP